MKALTHNTPVQWFGGTGTLFAEGVFTSVTLECKPAGDAAASWVAVGPDTSFAASPAVANFQLAGGFEIKVTVVGGGAGLGIFLAT